METHSSVLPWNIPWTEEPDGLQSMGSQRIRHDRVHKQAGEWNNEIDEDSWWICLKWKNDEYLLHHRIPNLHK